MTCCEHDGARHSALVIGAPCAVVGCPCSGWDGHALDAADAVWPPVSGGEVQHIIVGDDLEGPDEPPWPEVSGTLSFKPFRSPLSAEWLADVLTDDLDPEELSAVTNAIERWAREREEEYELVIQGVKHWWQCPRNAASTVTTEDPCMRCQLEDARTLIGQLRDLLSLKRD